jgi:hypothetical protein
MKEICDSIYKALYDNGSISTAAIIVGLILVLSHIYAFVQAPAAMAKLKTVPRSQNLGTTILTIDFLWGYVVATSIELGDFERLRWLAQFSVPVIYVAMLFWVNDYLGARAIGIFLLLAVCPALDAAGITTEHRWLLNLLLYIWLTLGLFWIGMPYTMRDNIAWATRTASRFKSLALAGTAWGAVLLVMAFTVWKGV